MPINHKIVIKDDGSIVEGDTLMEIGGGLPSVL